MCEAAEASLDIHPGLAIQKPRLAIDGAHLPSLPLFRDALSPALEWHAWTSNRLNRPKTFRLRGTSENVI